MNLHNLCHDRCVKIAQLVDKLVEAEIIAFNLILDEVFETTLSNSSSNCWWCLDL